MQYQSVIPVTVGGNLFGRYIHSVEKGGECVGNTRAGKGTLLMLAVDENGTPLNDVVASASVHEGHLAEAK